MFLKNSLYDHEEVYRVLLESASEGVVLADESGKIVMVNRKATEMFGYSSEEMLEEGIDMLVPDAARGRHQQLRNGFMADPKPRNMGVGLNLSGRRKDGSEFPIEVSLSPISVRGEKLVLCLVIDITEKVRAENLSRIQEQQLIQADKMTTLGILVSGVAHEINNPNNFIMLNAGIMKEVWRDIGPILEKHFREEGDFNMAGMPFSRAYPRIDKLISGTVEGADRIKRIVESLKNFARQDHGELNEVVRINKLIESAVTITHNLIKRSTNHFTISLGENIPEFNGNCQQLEQVIINLITNACQALRNSSDSLTICSKWHSRQRKIQVEVSDSGSGITEENMKHIFDPFFTTKRTDGGTGLGLSISYNIVKNHRGELIFESAEGKGTTAIVSIPVKPNGHKNLEK